MSWTRALVPAAAAAMVLAACKATPVVSPPTAPPLRRFPAIGERPLTERCALVATILTAPPSTLPDGPITLDVTLAEGDGGAMPLFQPSERCSERLTVARPGAEPPAGSTAASMSLTSTTKDRFTFRTAMAGQATAGETFKDAEGEWRVEAPGGSPRKRRQLDAAPIARESARPLPAGLAEARFEIDTGGDIMGAPAGESGLAVVVRYDRRELRQMIASCNEASSGNALGDTGGSVLDIAACDGLYRLVHRREEILVEREAGDGGSTAVTTIALPKSIRNVQRHQKAKVD